MFGASSATGDPPWFFVSPYLKNGTVVSYLKGIASGELGRGKLRSMNLSSCAVPCFLGPDHGARMGSNSFSRLTSGAGRRKTHPGPLQMMQEISVGMAYLHKEDVLHGDLKVC